MMLGVQRLDLALDVAAFHRNGRGGTPPVNNCRARKYQPTYGHCAGHTPTRVFSHLAAIMRQPEFPPSARLQAIAILLDRGWGRAPQPHTGEDDKEIRVTIRDLVAERRQEMAGGPITGPPWEPPSC